MSKGLGEQLTYSGSSLDARETIILQEGLTVDGVITNISNAYPGLKVKVIERLEKSDFTGELTSSKVYEIKKTSNRNKPLPASQGGYELIKEPRDLKYSDGTSFLNENGNINSDTKLIEISDKIDKLPSGIYYGQYSSVENLPAIGTLEQKGYAYVSTIEPNVYYIYLYNGDGEEWQDSGNKFVTTELETNLSTKSQTKAPTTEAVANGIEAVDITLARSAEDENELTKVQKYNASANINDRAVVSDQQTNEVKALGYKVLNSNASFASLVVDANTVYEIRDYFDLSGTEQEPAVVTIPANCKLRFEGGMLGGEFCTLQGNNTLIESDSVCIQKGVKIDGTWGNDVIYTKWLEFVSAKDAYLPAAAGTAGVMAPIFEDGTYYKSGRDYVLLNDEPDDWATNYTDYFQIIDNEYVSVTPVAPAYAKNTYYKKEEDDTYTVLDSDDVPTEWDNEYFDYYTKSGDVYTPVSGVHPDFVEDTFYKDNDVGYEKVLIIPTNWLTNWSSYYVKDGNNYVTTQGIVDNPNATNNIDAFKQLEALINGSIKGCKVEFEKGYYQVRVNATPLDTATIGGVEYEVWRPTGNQPTNHVVLDIKNIPALAINLNQSHIKALKTTCPDWNVMRIVGIDSLSILNGTVEGFANRFGYPNYKPSYSSSLSGDYEFPVLIKAMCKIISINGITAYNSEGDAFMIGSTKSMVCDSWIIENTEIHHCGRDGITAYSSNYATCINTYIHNIGSDGGHGVIGSDGIKGMDGRAGLNFEFEDSFKLRPVVHLDSMRIETCAKSSITEMSHSPLKTFTATNMYIHGTLNSSYIRTIDGKATFRDSVFIHEGGAKYNIGTLIYDNCFFTLKKPLYISENTFRNCRIIDEAPTDFSGQIIFYDNGEQAKKGRLEDCYISLKNKATIFKKEIIGCTIVFEKKGAFITLIGSNLFKNTKFESTVEESYNNCLFANSTNDTNVFEKCEFINLKGTNASNPGLNIMTNLVFTDCKGNFKISSYGSKTVTFDNFKNDGSLYLSGTNMTTPGGYRIINSDIYKLTKNSSVPLEIKNSRIVSTGIFNGTNTIEDSTMSFAPAGADYYPLGTFKNCHLTMSSAMNNASNNRVTLENCYIAGDATQAAFKGAAIDCTFENNADSGTYAQRPLYNLVVGQKYYDTILGKPIFWNGVLWIDANGDYIFDNSGSLQNRLAITAPIKGQQFKLTRKGETDVYLIYGDYGWLNATDRTPWFDDSGTLNAMYDKYNYTLLTAEPSNWATAYNTYYKIVDGVYTKLNAFETWADDTFYQLDVNTYKRIQVKLTDVDTELHDKVVKWNGTKYIDIVDNIALKAGTPTLAFGEVEEEIDGEQVSVTQATITSTSSGKIYYTKNGDAPTSASSEYSNPIDLATGDQVKAICIRDHMDNSNVGFVPVSTPVITFNDGILHIECDTPDVKIYYTTDGNPPSTSSTVYDSSASVTIAKNVTVKAFAILIGRVNSEVATKKRS